MDEKDKSCCSNPELGKLDKKSSKSLRNFAIGFLIIVIVSVVLLFLFKDAPGIRHLFMSPQQMEEHLKQ